MAIHSKREVPVPAEIVPYAPENIKLSKAEFVAKEKKRREIEKQASEYRKKLEKGETPQEPIEEKMKDAEAEEPKKAKKSKKSE